MQYKTAFIVCIFFVLLGSCKTVKPRNENWATKVKVKNTNNFFKVTDSIYRAAQPSQIDFIALENFGIKSVLNLRADETDSLKIIGLPFNYFQTKIVTAHFTESEIINALINLKNAPKPLLIHCKHGADRTGLLIALYRIIYQNWTKTDAIKELKNGGFGFHTQYKNIPNFILNVAIDKLKKAIKF